MATAVWQDVDGDWDNTSNWTGGAGAGGVPANGDTAFIASGTQNIDTNLSTGLTSVTLRVGPGYSGTIGSTSGYLDIDGPLADLDSRGDVYMTGVWTAVDVNGMASSSTAVQFKGSTSTDIGTLRVLGGTGTVTIGTSAVLDDVEVIGARRATVVITQGITSLDTVKVESGTVSVGANVATSVTVDGGSLTMTDSATSALTIVNGGLLKCLSTGTITALKVYGGRFDLRDLAGSSLTISAATVWGGVLDGETPLKQVTYTGGVLVNGGTFRPPVGSTITLS